MTPFDWNPYLVGGGTRPDAMTGLDADFHNQLALMFQGAPEPVRNQLQVLSAYRSPEVQERLWNDALERYGDPEIADNWVARPGTSNHNHGRAVDLRYLDPSAREWVHANAERFGLTFPMEHEPWHIEPIDGYAPEQPAENALAMGQPEQPQQQMQRPLPQAPMMNAADYMVEPRRVAALPFDERSPYLRG